MKLKISVVLILLALLCIGCSDEPESTSNRGTAPNNGKELTILCPPDAAAWFRDLADKYQTESTPRFVVEELKASDYGQSVAENLAGKKPADLVVFTQATDPPSAELCTQLRDLSSLKGIEDTLLRLEEGESLSLLPLCGDVPVVFYNADFFKENGVGTPTSLFDFESRCLYFQDQGFTTVIGVAPLKQSAQEAQLLPLLEPYLLNSGRLSSFMMEPFFRTLAEVKIFEQSSDRAQCFAALQDGTCPMLAGYWSDCALLESMKLPFRYEAFLFAGERPELNGALIPAVSVAVSAAAEEGAEEFATYLLSEAAQKQLCDQSGAKPIKGNADSLSESEKDLYGMLASFGLKPSRLSALSAEDRTLVLQEISSAVAGEEADLEQFQNIINSDSVKGDVP